MDKLKRYEVNIHGERDLLLHFDNLPFADQLKKWRDDPANKSASTPGDDRSPSWSWLGCLYHDNGLCVIPADNLMTVLREGGKRVSSGKRGATLKAASQSGLLVDQASWPLLVNGKPLSWNAINAWRDEPNFGQHEKLALEHGFELFVKRAKVGTAKHIRVRPRFRNWSCSGTITVLESTITREVLQTILAQAGRYAGLGDWRPSSPKAPGPFGTFTATVTEITE